MIRETVTYKGMDFSYTVPEKPNSKGEYCSTVRFEQDRKITKRVQKKKSLVKLKQAISRDAIPLLYNEIALKTPTNNTNIKNLLTFDKFLKLEFDHIASPAVRNWKWSTKRQYKSYVYFVFPHLPAKPFALLIGEDYDNAIQAYFEENKEINKTAKSKNPNHKTVEYNPKTKEKFYSIFNMLLDYAVFKGYIANNELKEISTLNDSTSKTSINAIKKRRQSKRSLSLAEDATLWELIEQNYDSLFEPIYIFCAIMNSTGVRTGECCALRYDDVITLREAPRINALSITREITGNNNIPTSLLKTNNAFRQIPLHKDITQMIFERCKKIMTEFSIDENKIGDAYIANHPNDPMTPYSAKDVNKSFGKLIHEVCEKGRANELIRAFDEDDIGENDPLLDSTSYIMRKNFCTYAYSVCAMEQDEVRYLMGHNLAASSFEEAYEKSRFFSEHTGQVQLYKKLSRRPLLHAGKPGSTLQITEKNSVGELSNSKVTLKFALINYDRAVTISVTPNEPNDGYSYSDKVNPDLKAQIMKAPCKMNPKIPPDFSSEIIEQYSLFRGGSNNS